MLRRLLILVAAISPTAVSSPAGFEAPVPPPGFVYYHDVPIGQNDGRALRMHICAPEDAPPRPLPVVAYIHGGGWNHGSKDAAAKGMCGYGRRGYVGAAFEYRLTSEAGAPAFPAQLHDVKLAVRYLRAHAARYHLDPDRIGVWGVSAGGHLAALLGTTAGRAELEGNGDWRERSSAVQAVVNISGPADFTTDFAQGWRSVTALLGGAAWSVPDKARAAMPGSYASAAAAPILILHGDADTTVPHTDSITLRNQLRAAGAPVEMVLVKGARHSLSAFPWTTELAWSFLDHHLKGAQRPDVAGAARAAQGQSEE